MMSPVDTGAWRRRSDAFRVWSSAPDDPRFRRPTDVLLLAGALISAIVLFVAPGQPALDAALGSVATAVIGALDWLWQLSLSLLVVWAVILIVVAAATRGRQRLLLDYLLAAAAALLLSLLTYRIVVGAWPGDAGDFVLAEPHPSSIVLLMAVAVAITVTASPHLTHALRLFGRGTIALGAIAGVGLGIALPSGAALSICAGITAGVIAHLVLGTPSGHPTIEQVLDSLADIGISAEEAEFDPVQRPGVTLVRARAMDGEELIVKVYGRDAWDGQVVGSIWTGLTKRGAGRLDVRTRASRVEHEALAAMMAERAGVAVAAVRAAGCSDEGDALVVTDSVGDRLSERDPENRDPAFVPSAWSALNRLHDIGMAHGDLDSASILIRPDGTAALSDFDDAHLAAARPEQLADRACLLVATAMTVGRDAAVTAAIDAIGTDGLAEVLPYLQPAVLNGDMGRAVRDEEWTLEELRAAAVEATGVEAPPLEKIKRVTPASVATVALIALMAYFLIGMLAGVDLASVVQELSSASMPLLVLALVMSPVVQASYSFSTLGASYRRLRYYPVLMLEYAIQFIALTLPSTAARLALSIRFFQRFGLPAAAAVTVGMIDSFSGFLVQIALIVLILVSGLPAFTSPILGTSTTSTTSTTDSSTPSILALLVVLAVLAIIVTLIVPRLRHRLLSIGPRIRSAIKDQTLNARESLSVIRRPRKVATMLAGNLGAQVLQAIILGVCLAAFGETAYLSQLILINTAVSLFAGLMPVPGGMGVAEAGYTAGLQAIGIPSAIAISTAIAFRLVTFYLPPIWGSFAMRWLRRNSYV